ncbi:MAG: hypothetical protein ACOYLR_08800 [Chlorobium sp.]
MKKIGVEREKTNFALLSSLHHIPEMTLIKCFIGELEKYILLLSTAVPENCYRQHNCI